MSPAALGLWADIASTVGIGAAVAGGLLAYFTLRAILAQLKASQWSTLLLLEQEMANRQIKFRDIADELSNTQKANPAPADLVLLQTKFDAARESYFNAIDRLASLVLNGQFPERELKQDYHDVLKDIIRAYPADFGPGTRYRKAHKLYEKWEG